MYSKMRFQKQWYIEAKLSNLGLWIKKYRAKSFLI